MADELIRSSEIDRELVLSDSDSSIYDIFSDNSDIDLDYNPDQGWTSGPLFSSSDISTVSNAGES